MAATKLTLTEELDKIVKQLETILRDKAKDKEQRSGIVSWLNGTLLETIDTIDAPRFAMLPSRIQKTKACGKTFESLAKALPDKICLGNGTHVDSLVKSLFAFCINLADHKKILCGIEEGTHGAGAAASPDKASDSDVGLGLHGEKDALFLVECKSKLADAKGSDSYQIQTNKTLGSCDAYFIVTWKSDAKATTCDTLENLLPLIRCVIAYDTEELHGHKSTKKSMRFCLSKLNSEASKFDKKHAPLEIKTIWHADMKTETDYDYTDIDTWLSIGECLIDWFCEKRENA